MHLVQKEDDHITVLSVQETGQVDPIWLGVRKMGVGLKIFPYFPMEGRW